MSDGTFTNLRRVKTDSGSHIEPALDDRWDELTKLRWKAAVVRADCTGLDCTVIESTVYRGSGLLRKRVRNHFDVQQSNGSTGPFTFRDAWDYLNGVSAGWNACKSADRETSPT